MTGHLEARHLYGGSIDLVVAFRYQSAVGIDQILIGVLREIHHDAEGTTVHICAINDQVGSKASYPLAPETVIIFGDAEDRAPALVRAVLQDGWKDTL